MRKHRSSGITTKSHQAKQNKDRQLEKNFIISILDYTKFKIYI